MGTNYYVIENQCDKCGRKDLIHIGKQSFGWRFLFNLNGKRFYGNANEFKEWIKDKQIFDEYGRPITHETFWNRVEAAQKNEDTLIGIEELTIDGYRFLDAEFS